MKAIIWQSALCGLVAFFGGAARAQVTAAVTITLTAQLQGISTTTGTITTTAASTKVAINNKSILAALAVAEHAAGSYASATFPVGAKLMAIVGQGNNAGPAFEVLDKNNDLLVAVSNVMTGTGGGTYGSRITSGKENDTTSLADPSRTKAQVVSIAYNDTGISGSGNLEFTLFGLLTQTTTDTVPNSTTHIYKETRTETMTGGCGDGNDAGVPMVMTGAVTISGSASLTN